MIKEHKYTLYKVRLESVEEDVYGNIDVEGWGQFSDYVGVPIGDVKDNAFINGRGFKRGFPYFWKNVLVNDDDFRVMPGLMDGGNIKSKSLGVTQKKSGTT